MNEPQRQTEAFLQGVLDAIPDTMAVLDKAGVIIKVNRAWMAAADEGNLPDSNGGLGTNYLEVCDQVLGDEQADAEATALGIRQIIQGERTDFSLVYPCHTPTQQRWFMLRLGRLDVNHQPYVVVMHVNITARVAAEQSLLQSRAAMATIQQFADFIHKTSHELRTPLSVISTSLYLLQKYTDPDKQALTSRPD